MKAFADLHHHSEQSILDGYGSIETHVKRCIELEHTAVALTEHGTCRGFVALDEACRANKIKPIFGCEVYVCPDHMRSQLSEEQIAAATAGLKSKKDKTAAKVQLEAAEGIHERRHLGLLAGSDEGLRNLIRITNRANTHGYYYKPRVDLDLLERYSEGVFVTSGCLGGLFAQSFLDGDIARLCDDIEWFVDVFGDRFSLELQPHPIVEQAKWNRALVKLSETFDVPLVVANDSHYPKPDDWTTHDTLVCVGHGRKIHDCDRLRYESETFGIKSADDMFEAFDRAHSSIPRATVEAAIERAAEIAERCTAELWKPSGVLLPAVAALDEYEEVEGDEGDASDDALLDLCEIGWEWREVGDRPKRFGLRKAIYLDRLEHELKVIADKGFARYFLIVHELMNWARLQGILTGPGRGSAAGSLVCYLLGITSIDPIEHGLLFERFLTPGRPDWPDIDLDIERVRRPEVLQHLRDQYGEDCVAQISTMSRMRARSALRDVARVYGVSSAKVEALSSTIVEDTIRGEGEGALAAAIEASPALQAFAEEHPEVVSHGVFLEGHARHVGIHPAGVVTSPIPLADFIPLERRKSHGEVVIVTAYDMRDCEKVGLIKLDVLGLRTLSIIADALREIKRRHGVTLDLETLPFDDRATLDAFSEGDFVGVFQFDTPAARGACSGVVFDTFEDIVAINALNRPGPAKSGLADEWRSLKAGGKGREKHPIIKAICSDTLGVIVYQEHVIRILQELAGYSPADAGRLRKAISKSKGVGYLEAERPIFVKGAAVNGMKAADADGLWTQIEEFGRYGFNKSHAAAYSTISYWCQWLKIKYPVEFFCGLIANEDEAAVANRFVREASRRGVRICPPDINTSGANWTIRGEALVVGLSNIKRVGGKACADLAKHAPFSDLPDFVTRVRRQLVNKGVIGALIKAGAMKPLLPNTRWALENFERLLSRVGRKGWVDEVNAEIEASRREPDFDEADAWCIRLEVGVNGDGRHPLGAVADLFEDVLRDDFVDLEHARDGSWVRGAITGRKVGTSRGEKWAAIEIEDANGDKLKLKFRDADYHKYREVLDLGVGGLVAANIIVNKYGNTSPAVLVDLLDIRRRLREDESLTPEQCSAANILHPLRDGEDLRSDFWREKDGGRVLILNVNLRRDRHRRRFAFVRVDAGVGDTREVLVFADVFDVSKRLLHAGEVVRIRAKREKRGSLIAQSVHKVKGVRR